MRLRCKLFGCSCHEFMPECERCQAGIYDYDYIQLGWLHPFRQWGEKVAWWWRCNVYRRCNHCDKPMWCSKKDLCSPQCEEAWRPF